MNICSCKKKGVILHCQICLYGGDGLDWGLETGGYSGRKCLTNKEFKVIINYLLLTF